MDCLRCGKTIKEDPVLVDALTVPEQLTSNLVEMFLKANDELVCGADPKQAFDGFYRALEVCEQYLEWKIQGRKIRICAGNCELISPAH